MLSKACNTADPMVFLDFRHPVGLRFPISDCAFTKLLHRVIIDIICRGNKSVITLFEPGPHAWSAEFRLVYALSDGREVALQLYSGPCMRDRLETVLTYLISSTTVNNSLVEHGRGEQVWAKNVTYLISVVNPPPPGGGLG